MDEKTPRIVDAEYEVITPAIGDTRSDKEVVSDFFETVLFRVFAVVIIGIGWLLFGPLYQFFKWLIGQP